MSTLERYKKNQKYFQKEYGTFLLLSESGNSKQYYIKIKYFRHIKTVKLHVKITKNGRSELYFRPGHPYTLNGHENR